MYQTCRKMRLKKQDFSQPSKFGYSKEKIWVFRKNLWICRNRRKLKILLLDATEKVRPLKTLKNYFLLEKKIGFSEKKSWVFSKTAKSINQFDAECNWIGKISQNVQNFCFFFKKQRLVFRKSSCFFLKSLKVANFHYKATGKKEFSKHSKNWCFS